MGRKRNTFSKAIKQLKSTRIDEKLQVLNEIPTNSTSGLYSLVPGALTRVEIDKENPTIPDYSTIDWDVDGSDGKDTSGLFDGSGESRFIAPPGDNSYILGPMSAMFYNYWAGNHWTMIGYIRESDRRMVNLGYVQMNSGTGFNGELDEWDGVNHFTSYGQLTLEQARWFRDTAKKDGAGTSSGSHNYRAFYPGPPSSTPDAFGRYLCAIVGTPKVQKDNAFTRSPIDLNVDSNFSAMMDRIKDFGKNVGDFGKNIWDAMSNVGGTTWGKLGGSILRSVMDPITYAGDMVFKGLPSGTPYNPAFKGAGPKWLGGKKLTDMLGGLFGKDVQYFTPDLDTAIKYAGEGGSVVAMPRPNTGVQGMKNWLGSTVSRGFDPTKGVEQIVRTSDSVAAANVTKVINLSDEGSAATLKALARKGATNNKVLKTVGKAVPFLNAGLVATDVTVRIAQGDYAGALLGGLQIIPGPIGWVALASQVAYDVSGSKKNIPWNKPVSEAVDDSSMSDNMGAALIEMGLPKDKKEFIKETGFYLMLQDQIDPNLLSMLLKALQGEELSSEQKKWMDKNFQPMIDAVANRNSDDVKESYISEERKLSILKNLKKPVVLPETKQKSYKVSPGKRLNQKTNFQGMDKLIGDTKLQKTFKKPQDIWSQDWQGYNAKLSQNKKNEVLELIGNGKQSFDYMLTDSRAKNAEEMEKFWGLHPELYSYNFNGKKYKATRKEQIKGDYIVFLVDEVGEKSSILQSVLNEKLAEEDEKRMLDEYNKLNPKNEPIPYEKDPLFKKVAKRLKNEIDYPDKPARKGYPNEPPPKQVDGWHPDYGKRYKYDKLDPVSAVAMRNAPTGNPEIDANVEKAARKPKI